MKKITAIVLFLFSVPVLSFSQDWFIKYKQGDKVEGYIIGIAGDTIHGFIQYDYPVIMQKKVEFYSGYEDTNSKTYTPEDIRGYQVDNRVWESIQVLMETYNGIYKFSRFGILQSEPGAVSLYRILEEEDKLKKRVNSEEAEKMYENISLHHKEGSLENVYIKKREHPAEAIFTREFKRSFVENMKTYIGNYDELMARIRNKELDHDDLKTIVAEYNQWFSANRGY